MSGHNKWSKVKHKKAAADAKRSREFSKFAQLISAESKKSAGDRESPGLKMAIEKAKQVNMPKDVIERAVLKGKGGGGDAAEQVIYETYGPGGVAVIIEGITNNKNRTGAEIKHLLSSYGLSLAEPGSAMWAFEKEDIGWSARTTIPLKDGEKEKLNSLVRVIGEHDDVQEVYTNAS